MKENDVNHRGIKEDKTGIAFNSPAVGLNDNLEFMGRRLHVQTEHSGFPAARIITQVFSNGRVLMSKKTDCPPAVQESHDISKLQQLMNDQHHQVIQEIADKQTRILRSQ